MVSVREMFGVFFGRKPMAEFASQRHSIFDGIMNYAVAVIFPSILLALEFLILNMLSSFVAKHGTMSILIGTALTGVGLAIAVVIGLVAGIVLLYIWGAIHFFLARFYAGMPGGLNDFNGSWLTLMGSITLVQKLLLLPPILAWFGSSLLSLGPQMQLLLTGVLLLPALIIQLYGILLAYRFIKARFSLSPARAAIVVLLPLGAVLLAMLVLSIIVLAIVGAGMK